LERYNRGSHRLVVSPSSADHRSLPHRRAINLSRCDIRSLSATSTMRMRASYIVCADDPFLLTAEGQAEHELLRCLQRRVKGVACLDVRRWPAEDGEVGARHPQVPERLPVLPMTIDFA
jgi:hypothetical protein